MLTVLRPRFIAELHGAGGRGEQRVVAAAADVDAGMEVGAALADDDLAGLDDLAAEPLDAEPLGSWSRDRCVSWKRPSCVPLCSLPTT